MDFEVAKLMHQIIHKKLPIILNHTLHIHLIAQHTRQKSANHLFLPRFILLEHNQWRILRVFKVFSEHPDNLTKNFFLNLLFFFFSNCKTKQL